MAKKNNPFPSLFWLFGLLILSIVGAIIWLTVQSSPITKPLTDARKLPTSTPTPTPAKLPPGPYTYGINFSPTKKGLPIFTTLTVDPLDAQKTQTQKISIDLSSESPISAVSVRLFTDTTKQTAQLSQTLAQQNASTWSTEIVIEDTTLYRYVFELTATNATGESKTYVAPRTVGPIKISDLR